MRIDACSRKNTKMKHETETRLIENRPYVRGILGSCYETDMLVDYGASTSVISKSVIDEIEKRMGDTLP